MFNSYTHRRGAYLPWILFLAVALRSLVAPGYEFVNDGHHGEFSLGIAWCPGLNGINLADGLEGPGHDHDPNSSETSNGDHFTATCGLWAGNTSYVSHVHLFSQGLLDPGSEVHALQQPVVHPYNYYRRNHPPRGPPVYLTV